MEIRIMVFEIQFDDFYLAGQGQVIKILRENDRFFRHIITYD